MIGAFVFDQVIFFQFTAGLAKDYLPGVDVFDNPVSLANDGGAGVFRRFFLDPGPDIRGLRL